MVRWSRLLTCCMYLFGRDCLFIAAFRYGQRWVLLFPHLPNGLKHIWQAFFLSRGVSARSAIVMPIPLTRKIPLLTSCEGYFTTFEYSPSVQLLLKQSFMRLRSTNAQPSHLSSVLFIDDLPVERDLLQNLVRSLLNQHPRDFDSELFCIITSDNAPPHRRLRCLLSI